MEKNEYINLWIKKADGDLKVAKRELNYDDSVLDAVCFHLQQAVEKYAKGFLANDLQKIRKTHNLAFLIEQCIEVDGSFSQFEEQFDNIAECGVEIRYPDTFIIFQKKELQDALTVVEEFRTFVLSKLEQRETASGHVGMTK